MKRHVACMSLLRSTLVVFASGFACSSFALADEPAAEPATPSTAHEAQTTPAEAGEVQTRAARGGANSKTRAEWCGDHLVACYASGDAYCKGHYSDPVSLKICNDSVTDSCGRSWGSASTCMTDPLLSGLWGNAIPSQNLSTLQLQQTPAPGPMTAPLGTIQRRGVEDEQPDTGRANPSGTIPETK